MRAPYRKFSEAEKSFLIEMCKTELTYQTIIELFNKRFAPAITESHVSNFIYKKKLRLGRRGHRPGRAAYNKLSVGSEYVTTTGRIRVKTAPGQWRLKQRVIWESEYGSIPRNHVVIFLDGNHQNFNLENLMAVSKNESMALTKNELRSSDPDLTRSGLALTRLNLLTRTLEREKRANHEKQTRRY